MEFEWSEEKRNEVFQKRKVDILYAARIFRGDVLTFVDDRADYGEERLISLGMVDDTCFVVVHTERAGRTRLITAWKGGRDERQKYETGIARRNRADE